MTNDGVEASDDDDEASSLSMSRRSYVGLTALAGVPALGGLSGVAAGTSIDDGYGEQGYGEYGYGTESTTGTPIDYGYGEQGYGAYGYGG